jgi:hypothetical protein
MLRADCGAFRASSNWICSINGMYVAGTSEDPANGAHDAFFNEVIEISKESKIFKQPLNNKELTKFLNP